MFEKEAEIYALSNYGFRGKNSQRVLTAKIDWQKGAEFGFQKGIKAKINTTTISDCPIKNQWHKVFEGDPYSFEYWDLPQENLPKIENFYFVKLKNGFIKICELKYDHWSRKKCFYDLHGGKQSNVAEWLEYPTT